MAENITPKQETKRTAKNLTNSKTADKYIVHSDIDKEFNIEKNDVNLYENYDSIIQSLWNIISTEQGEMPFLMEFGTDLKKYIFEPGSPTSLEKIKNDFILQVQRWEDRIEIIDARINIYGNLGMLKIDLLFSIGQQSFKESFVVKNTGRVTGEELK